MWMNTLLVGLMLAYSWTLSGETQGRILFDFTHGEEGTRWRTVNDGVMGGRSDGRFRILDGKTMEFFGTLSLENNGGFASVRSRPAKLGLRQGDALIVRLKGDGRRYSMNLYVPTLRTAFSYRVEFDTRKDRWIEIRAPLEEFVATSYGRVLHNFPEVDPSRITSMGFLLGDKRQGPFSLEIDWIKVEDRDPRNEAGQG